jgi:hypothetical protein
MSSTQLPLKILKPNPDNPRIIKDDNFTKLIYSLLAFPKMMALRPIVHKDFVVYGGNMRLRAINFIVSIPKIQFMEYVLDHLNPQLETHEQQKEAEEIWVKIRRSKSIPSEWVKDASTLTPEEIRQFTIKDNSTFGDWDYESLANLFDSKELQEWGISLGDLEGPKIPEPSHDEGINYNSQFGVIVICENETDQEKVFNDLKAAGYTCKIVVT